MTGFSIYVSLALLVAYYASTKGRSGVKAFFLSFFLTPLIGLIVVSLLRESSIRKMQRTMEAQQRPAEEHLNDVSKKVQELKDLKKEDIISEEEYQNRISALRQAHENRKNAPVQTIVADQHAQEAKRGKIAGGIVAVALLFVFAYGSFTADEIADDFNITYTTNNNGNITTRTYSNRNAEPNPFGEFGEYRTINMEPVNADGMEARIVVDPLIGYDSLKATLFDAYQQCLAKAGRAGKVQVLAYADERNINNGFSYGRLRWQAGDEEPTYEIKDKVGRLTEADLPTAQEFDIYFIEMEMVNQSNDSYDTIEANIAKQYNVSADQIRDAFNKVEEFMKY
ncbi:hypothetical protein [Persicobacter psychrovividus]|uniref:SHOCT domain-containing protein n=1 Tax=Persicobacter psychrovividus TaxID=387638 RepID=A0ABM7VH53_9BACT|nr:hypothetical protein PEPS_25640 [Persicobacter psychrovividus]